jgi:fermentation-respiration switch protein FrsA (DUF1100 family)
MLTLANPHRGAAGGRLLLLTALGVTMSGCMLANPVRTTVGPAPTDLGAKTVSYASGSGSTIRAWFAPGQRGGGAVLLLHGVGSNRTSMLARARFLHDEGFTILAPDFQAEGESTGDHITFGARESLDAAASMQFLRRAAPDEKIGVIGVSMGGAAALLGPGPLDANAFVLESVYPTIQQAVGDRLSAWFGPLGGVARLFTPAVIHFVGDEAGVTAADLQPIERIGRVRAPLLLLAGTADPYTRLVEAESLYARAPEPKSSWLVNGAGHEDLYDYAPAEYEQRVGRFLLHALRGVDALSSVASRSHAGGR